ncbi:MAG TPA: hypothetical protein VL860_13175, partial [Planctomycetota bacterium]|nr:hypothetical protein [Planctomycetota bacterium]
LAVGVGTVIAIKLLAPSMSGPGSGSPSKPSAPVPAPSAYVAKTPSDKSFSAEVPRAFSFTSQATNEFMPEGKSILVHRYIAGGGKGIVDGFAVLRLVDYVDKRAEDLSQDAFLTLVVDRFFEQKQCKPGTSETARHKVHDCLHVEGEGLQGGELRPYYMVMEAFITNNDVVLLIVAGYQKGVLTDPATVHFFDTFALTEPD